MAIDAREMLSLWQQHHGPLDERWRDAFLNDERVRTLQSADASMVREGLERYRRLDLVIQYVNRMKRTRKEEQKADDKGSGRARTSGNPDRSRFSGGHYPHQPNDSQLHKAIGPTQSYLDDF